MRNRYDEERICLNNELRTRAEWNEILRNNRRNDDQSQSACNEYDKEHLYLGGESNTRADWNGILISGREDYSKLQDVIDKYEINPAPNRQLVSGIINEIERLKSLELSIVDEVKRLKSLQALLTEDTLDK